jgi:CheY-like chemotaxis protein
MLQKRGHTVTVACDGREALNALASESFDLVLMDIQMPEMDGVEAVGLIRQREAGSGRHIPVVALSAHAMSGDRESFLASGMDDYLEKPIQTGQLKTVLNRIPRAVRA